MTRMATGGAVFVLAIIFGLIFWTQFSSNQQHLAGSNTLAQQKNETIKHDNLDTIDADLSGSNINSIDSDSAQMDSKLKAY